MKVLHLLSSTGYHGAENMAAELIKQLDKLGVRNHVGVFYDQKKTNKDLLDVVEPYVEGSAVFRCRGKIDFSGALALRKYIKDEEIEIIHSHKYKTNVYSLLANFSCNRRLISTCHNWVGSSFKMQFYAFLDKNILRYFNMVIGVSDEVTDELKKYVTGSKVRKIANGVDIEKFRRKIDIDDAKKSLGLGNKKIVGFVGRLSPDKGVSFLLKAVQQLAADGIDLYAFIAGSGDFLETLKSEAQSLGIGNRVIFAGNRTDTPLIYSALDVFVLPSLKEAFPMVVLEAMAAGAPVIATRVGDIPKIIQDNADGLLVEPRDVDALSVAISELLLSADKAERLALSASEKVRTRYSSASMALNYKEVYQEILK